MEIQKMTSKTTAKPAMPPREKPGPKECTLCKGELVLDAQGAAVFCDECWTLKCLESPAD